MYNLWNLVYIGGPIALSMLGFSHYISTGTESVDLGQGDHRIIVGFGRLEELETVEQKKLLATRVKELEDPDWREIVRRAHSTFYL